MNDFQHVLVATDMSETGLAALRYARYFADRFRSRLTVMYSDPVVYPVDVLDESASLLVTTAPEHEARLKRELEAYAEPWLHGRDYDIAVCIGQPIATILRTAEERHADLIAMGPHMRHGWRRALLGSVSEGVLHGSNIPVLTVSGESQRWRMPGAVAVTKIVCPINFSEVAHDAVRYATHVAEAFGAELIIVHVLEPGQASDAAADEERVRRWIEPDMQKVCTYRNLVVRGGAAERVLDCVEDSGADLLVIGAQHSLFRDATVIGTTTERLVRFADCPVLVVTRRAVQPEARNSHVEVMHV